jgi:pyrrolysyl-tRNA synthetase-like protein
MTSPDTAGGDIELTPTQSQRLRELGADPSAVTKRYASVEERNAHFKRLEDDLARAGRAHLQSLRDEGRAPRLLELEQRLAATLRAAGFVQVATPLIITGNSLDKMGIDFASPLRDQVFWVENGKCLRPMLAPNLYTLLRRLGRIWSRPFGIFEIGPCFRRDTKGSAHLNEFTMLNLVELGTPLEARAARLEELAALVMGAAGIGDYRLVSESSEVYGDELDIEVDGVEVCSTAVGPHPLDDAWGIVEPWVGLGFGLERLIVARDRLPNIERVGRSLSYVDGVRLNI